MANQRTQNTMIGLAVAITVALGLLALLGHVLWLVPVTLLIAILTSLEAYLKLKAIWARVLAFALFGLSLMALCLTPALFAAIR